MSSRTLDLDRWLGNVVASTRCVWGRWLGVRSYRDPTSTSWGGAVAPSNQQPEARAVPLQLGTYVQAGQ